MGVIEDLERKERSLADQLGDVRKSLYLARISALNLVPNETVLLCGGKEYLFVSADMFMANERPWASARMKKKDGTWMERISHLYRNWIIKENSDGKS